LPKSWFQESGARPGHILALVWFRLMSICRSWGNLTFGRTAGS